LDNYFLNDFIKNKYEKRQWARKKKDDPAALIMQGKAESDDGSVEKKIEPKKEMKIEKKTAKSQDAKKIVEIKSSEIKASPTFIQNKNTVNNNKNIISNMVEFHEFEEAPVQTKTQNGSLIDLNSNENLKDIKYKEKTDNIFKLFNENNTNGTNTNNINVNVQNNMNIQTNPNSFNPYQKQPNQQFYNNPYQMSGQMNNMNSYQGYNLNNMQGQGGSYYPQFPLYTNNNSQFNVTGQNNYQNSYQNNYLYQGSNNLPNFNQYNNNINNNHSTNPNFNTSSMNQSQMNNDPFKNITNFK